MEELEKQFPGLKTVLEYVMTPVKAIDGMDDETESLLLSALRYFIKHSKSYEHCASIFIHHTNSTVILDSFRNIILCDIFSQKMQMENISDNNIFTIDCGK